MRRIDAVLGQKEKEILINSFAGAQLEGRRGGGLPCPCSKFKEKCPDFGKKMPLLGSYMG